MNFLLNFNDSEFAMFVKENGEVEVTFITRNQQIFIIPLELKESDSGLTLLGYKTLEMRDKGLVEVEKDDIPDHVYLFKCIDKILEDKKALDNMLKEGRNLTLVTTALKGMEVMQVYQGISHTEFLEDFIIKTPGVNLELEIGGTVAQPKFLRSKGKGYWLIAKAVFRTSSGLLLQGSLYVSDSGNELYFHHVLDKEESNLVRVFASFPEVYNSMGVKRVGDLVNSFPKLSFRAVRLLEERSLDDLSLTMLEKFSEVEMRDFLRQSNYYSVHSVNEILEFFKKRGLRVGD